MGYQPLRCFRANEQILIFIIINEQVRKLAYRRARLTDNNVGLLFHMAGHLNDPHGSSQTVKVLIDMPHNKY
ncbi:hypothetical protein SDC9_155060 [bioreactor metagenome]|uniref:Uncharacterized protein n=1 Tax=bioreactor metagenome TaxID=1076179 RepID=A0A645F0E6_9ZZZZ